MNKLLAILAISTVLIGGLLIMKDPGHVPLFDADLNRLAESELEGFCAGKVFWVDRGGNPEEAAACRAEYSQMDNDYHLDRVQMAFCLGVQAAGWPGDPRIECLDILQAHSLWPTYDGALTDAWTKANPYPGDIWAPPAGTGSRTGGREPAPREEITR